MSACVMVWLTDELVLPEQSVDHHVLVIMVSPQTSVLVVSACVMTGEVSQSSVTVGGVKTICSLQFIVLFCP